MSKKQLSVPRSDATGRSSASRYSDDFKRDAVRLVGLPPISGPGVTRVWVGERVTLFPCLLVFACAAGAQAQPAEERFGIAILPRAARLDVQHLQAGLLAVTTDRRGDELRPIVAANVLRHATREEQVRQNIEHAIRRDAAIHFQRQALARVFVGDRKPLQRLPGWPCGRG